MRRTSRRVLLVTCAACCALAGGACSDSSSNGDSSSTTVPAADDQAAAEAAVLMADDLPLYEAAPAEPSSDVPESAKQSFSECMDTDVVLFGEDDNDDREADSPQFTREGVELENGVAFRATREEADERLALALQEGIEVCLEGLFDEVFAARTAEDPRVTVGATTVKRLEFPELGDGIVGYRGMVNVSDGVDSVDLYFDLVIVQQGRVIVTLDVSSQGRPFGEATELELLRVVVDRLPAET